MLKSIESKIFKQRCAILPNNVYTHKLAVEMTTKEHTFFNNLRYETCSVGRGGVTPSETHASKWSKMGSQIQNH